MRHAHPLPGLAWLLHKLITEKGENYLCSTFLRLLMKYEVPTSCGAEVFKKGSLDTEPRL